MIHSYSDYPNAALPGVREMNGLRKIDNTGCLSYDPKPYLYLSVFILWGLCLVWFGPRLWGLMDITYHLASAVTMALFILFICFAWLYGIYNVCIVIFSFVHRFWSKKPERELTDISLIHRPKAAILYTTCNDFIEQSVLSCIHQDYEDFTVYICDDSSDEKIKSRIDAFAAKYKERVQVIRRSDREGFKAGNMNHALEKFVSEPYFAIADADEILPTDFLSKLIPVMESDDKCGFVQANHRANVENQSELSKSLGIGVDIHWKYYQPLRNDYGFVMFLGHGALIRKRCWEESGKFPHIVSEDLGFAIHAREKGYRGRFVEDVVCLEDFPDTIRAFRIRHVKWTRGTCEFLSKKFGWLLRARNITWTEKLDILFPTMNLPLTLVYFLFMVIANLMLPFYFGSPQELTFELGSRSMDFTVFALHEGFGTIYTLDFFIITLMTFFAPVLCFVVGLIHHPLRLIRFISHSTAVYAALGTLSSIGVITYLISGKATFLVTGDKAQTANNGAGDGIKKKRNKWREFIHRSHPDLWVVQLMEITIALIFAIACIYMFQVSFLGLCLAFLMMPIFHRIGWDHRWARYIAHLPFTLIVLGVFLAGLSLIGIQTVFFGYGFHF